jgi:signal transduction histidine kinase
MIYRISLHLLAAIWNFILLVWALSLRKNADAYRYLIPVCFFAGAFCASWAFGLIFHSELIMRCTWVGALWPVAVIIFIRKMFDLPTKKWNILWVFSGLVCIGGFSPWGLIRITQYDPTVVAIYGPLEPALRIGLLIMILMALWTVVQLMFAADGSLKPIQKIVAFGFWVYGVSALVTCVLLPLFGHYEWMEATSYGSIIWTTLMVWMVFIDIHQRNQILSELDQYKKNLINHVTHEFRTPLNVIESSIEYLTLQTVSDRNPTQATEYMETINRNAKKLGYFIDDLLDLAAAQQSKTVLKRNESDLRDIVRAAIQQIQPLADAARVALNLEGESLLANVDERRIHQVLSNLLSNAIKASPQGAVIVQIESRAHEAITSISDNGIGIASEDIPFLFDSFYKAQTNKTAMKSSGLGLAVAKAWVEAHGGKIWAESDGEGKGTTVTFTLPI